MADIPRKRLFIASFLTLIAAGVGFGVRGGVLKVWGNEYGFTQGQLGDITGWGLVGFGLVILFASLITDLVGYKTILVAAFVCHVISGGMIMAADYVFQEHGKDAIFSLLRMSMIIFAVGNGLCEAAINPLVATLYPRQKTHYLNILHAGWPGGLILGGIIGYFLVGKEGIPWVVPMCLFLVPAVIYGLMLLVSHFPESEATAAGVSWGEMFLTLVSPILLFLFVLHALIGYVELGTDSWITNITGTITTDPEAGTNHGFFLFIYASAVMFILRFFAGPIVHKINPVGLLFLSSCLGALGLYLIGTVGSVAMVWVAVSVYAVGKTFLWPTMLGVVGERYPRGGAVTMGFIGGIGMLSAGYIGAPAIGYKQDYFASEHLKASSQPTYLRYQAAEESQFPQPFSALFPKVKGLDQGKVGVLADKAAELDRSIGILEKDGATVPDELRSRKSWWEGTGKKEAESDKKPVEEATLEGGQQALIYTALVPAAMAIGFLLLMLYFAARGGYKQVEIHHE